MMKLHDTVCQTNVGGLLLQRSVALCWRVRISCLWNLLRLRPLKVDAGSGTGRVGWNLFLVMLRHALESAGLKAVEKICLMESWNS